MDELIIQDYQRRMQYIERYCCTVRRPLIELKEVHVEPESDLPFTDEKEKFTDSPETAQQLYHLEKYGYFYK